MVRHLERFSKIIHEDNGKTLFEALTSEFMFPMDIMRYYEKNAREILRPRSRSLPIYFIGMKGSVVYEPVGVIGIIGPWNYPFQLAFVPAISALIAGNCVLVKHSSSTPMTGKIMEEVVQAAGLPPHVFNVIWGKGISGQYLADSAIDKLFFTGSTEIGKKLAVQAAERIMPVGLELGGSDPMVVLDDANLRRAARGAVWGSLFNGGQSCVSVERIYVTAKNYQPFIDLLKTEIERVPFGTKEHCQMGSVTTKEQLEQVEVMIQDAVKQGATLVWGGKRREDLGPLFFEPALLVDCRQDMTIIKEETFGPVVAVVPVDNEAQAVQYANDSRYGLSSSVFTENRARGYDVAGKLEAGSVGINAPVFPFIASSLPLGGFKESGLGSYHGPEGLRIFSRTKSIMYDGFWKRGHFGWYSRLNLYRLFLKFCKFWYR
jgi:acyl-CoA reductase-like NAD-dependent aldehyde dehydrogenase